MLASKLGQPFIDEVTGLDKSHDFCVKARGLTLSKAAELGLKSAARQSGIDLGVVELEEARHGFVLLPKRRVAERSFAWNSHFRHLARGYE